ncbi:MAG: hypothetical protein LUD79_04640 [Oscillospiraceae bacterium]|nr:hypothetical protein [Oscillospiraceae bacterium]
MTTQLSFIASNLDHYHFNTDEARALKREIQHWTTLPMNEQNAYAAEHRLLSRFQRMFVNNPYLEQKGLVWNADITGAAADAYFTKKKWLCQSFAGGSAAGICPGELADRPGCRSAGERTASTGQS